MNAKTRNNGLPSIEFHSSAKRNCITATMKLMLSEFQVKCNYIFTLNPVSFIPYLDTFQ